MSPLEIENLVLEHPGVKEAVVVGVPDELQGEVVVAFVVQRPGVELDEQSLRRFCREHLPAYKVPARVEVVEAIPRNPSGKPLKAELAARARSSTAPREGSRE